jgi:hypothetical protein
LCNSDPLPIPASAVYILSAASVQTNKQTNKLQKTELITNCQQRNLHKFKTFLEKPVNMKCPRY